MEGHHPSLSINEANICRNHGSRKTKHELHVLGPRKVQQGFAPALRTISYSGSWWSSQDQATYCQCARITAAYLAQDTIQLPRELVAMEADSVPSSDEEVSCNLSMLCQFSEPTTRSRWKSEVSLRFLEQVFDLNNPRQKSMCDVVLVSIDLEYNGHQRTIRQVGIASLDVANLSDHSAEDEKFTKSAISSQLFLMTGQEWLKHQRTHCYLFGTPELAMSKNLQDILLPMLAPVDTFGSPRDVILVGHSIEADIFALRHYGGFDIRALPSIKAVVDTAYISIPTPLTRPLSLEQTCRRLRLRTRQLHNAGNDAMYALKAALLLFVRYKSDEFLRAVDVGSSTILEEREFIRQYQLGLLTQIAKADNRTPRLPEMAHGLKIRN